MSRLSYVLNVLLLGVIFFYVADRNRQELLVFGSDAVLPDGSKYVGDFSNGKFSGNGILVYPSGDQIEGEFKNGYVDGRAVMKLANGDILTGEFHKGYASGSGVYTFAIGAQYKGEFDLGAFSGEGELTYENGQAFSGLFKDGSIVNGTHIDGFGNQYEGHFLDFYYHGHGRLTYASGDVYEGEFDLGVFDSGTHTSADGAVYKGEFEDSLFHGKGKLVYADGSYYEGSFAHNFMHGLGRLVSFDEQGNELVQEGEWKYGSFDEGENKNALPEPEYADGAIYEQEQLFNKWANELVDEDPDNIDFYFLGVAGDGSQNVFKSETMTLNDTFGARYDTLSKSLLLINHVETEGQYPLATHNGLVKALDIISAKMDIEHDVLILYMTSHGSEDHTFYINDLRMTLKGITRGDLRQALEASPIKWKIVLVSACYSGGHIESLQDEHTFIMTSARKDRTSFGCSYDSDMTYFGRAIYGALESGEEIFESFSSVDKTVHQMELDNDIEKHSFPQQFAGEKIIEHLQDWKIGQEKDRGGDIP